MPQANSTRSNINDCDTQHKTTQPMAKATPIREFNTDISKA